MKKYLVTVPITGYIEIEIEAENEKDAINKVFDLEEISLDKITEWKIHDKICEGNIFSGVLNEVEIEEIDY